MRRAKERVIEIEAKDEYLRQKKEADDKGICIGHRRFLGQCL